MRQDAWCSVPSHQFGLTWLELTQLSIEATLRLTGGRFTRDPIDFLFKLYSLKKVKLQATLVCDITLFSEMFSVRRKDFEWAAKKNWRNQTSNIRWQWLWTTRIVNLCRTHCVVCDSWYWSRHVTSIERWSIRPGCLRLPIYILLEEAKTSTHWNSLDVRGEMTNRFDIVRRVFAQGQDGVVCLRVPVLVYVHCESLNTYQVFYLIAFSHVACSSFLLSHKDEKMWLSTQNTGDFRLEDKIWICFQSKWC